MWPSLGGEIDVDVVIRPDAAVACYRMDGGRKGEEGEKREEKREKREEKREEEN